MKLKNITLSERSPPSKKKKQAEYCMNPLYEISRTGKFRETDSRRMVARG